MHILVLSRPNQQAPSARHTRKCCNFPRDAIAQKVFALPLLIKCAAESLSTLNLAWTLFVTSRLTSHIYVGLGNSCVADAFAKFTHTFWPTSIVHDEWWTCELMVNRGSSQPDDHMEMHLRLTNGGKYFLHGVARSGVV